MHKTFCSHVKNKWFDTKFYFSGVKIAQKNNKPSFLVEKIW